MSAVVTSQTTPRQVLPKSHRRPGVLYRADIDGLRAIAVLSVVLYHAGSLIASGGYIGVDVFFVISGYLITGIISSEIARGTFTITGFYERRVKRVFPALLAMCIVISLIAWFTLMPFDFKQFGESLVAVSLFVSNVYFYIKTDYFSQEAELRLLLHTWSLAVEEQYYLFFPLLLIFLNRFGGSATKATISMLFAISLVASVVALRRDAPSVFFMIWYRAWELFAGSLVALRVLPTIRSGLSRQVLSGLGLLLIGYALFSYSASTRFPGEAALPPVIGSALIIYAGEGGETYVSRALSCRTMVFIGLISYSLYLWHWPIFVIFRYLTGRDAAGLEAAALIVLAFCAATLSWRLIEQPIRQSKRLNRKQLFAGAAGCMALIFSFGLVAHINQGIPQRLSPFVAAAAMTAMDINPRRNKCDSRTPERISRDDVCLVGADSARPSFVVVGDSFADALIPGIDAMASESGFQGYALTRGGCLPLKGVNQDIGQCRAFTDAALDFINRHSAIRMVLLVGRWTTAAEGVRFGSNKTASMFISDDQTAALGYSENRRVLTEGLKHTLEALASRQVFIGAFIPEQPVNVPRFVGVSRLLGRTESVGVDRSIFDSRQLFVRELMDEVAVPRGASVLDFGQLLCDQSRCEGERDGSVLYWDDNHLSATEAISLRNIFAPMFTNQ